MVRASLLQLLYSLEIVETTCLVYSMGTETRRSPEEYIPPQPMPYDYVVFRASEVQNLAVDAEPRPQPRSAMNDPAVLGVRITSSSFNPQIFCSMGWMFSLHSLPPHLFLRVVELMI